MQCCHWAGSKGGRGLWGAWYTRWFGTPMAKDSRSLLKVSSVFHHRLHVFIFIFIKNCHPKMPSTKILRSSTTPLLKQQPTTNNISKRAFRMASPAIWNSLPLTIKNSISVSSLKYQFETLKLAYNLQYLIFLND